MRVKTVKSGVKGDRAIILRDARVVSFRLNMTKQ